MKQKTTKAKGRLVMKSVSFLRLGKVLLFSFFLAFLLLVVLSFFLYRSENPVAWLSTATMISTLLGAGSVGYFGLKINEEKKVLFLALCGILYFSLIFLFSFVLRGEMISFGNRVFLFAGGLLSLLIGSFMSKKIVSSHSFKQKKRARQRRKIHVR